MDWLGEKSTPFDFDLEIWGVYWSLSKYFGEDFVEKEDVKDLFRDFSNDKMLFVQLWDTINYHILENSVDCLSESG